MLWAFQNGTPDLPALPAPDQFSIKTISPEMTGVPWTFQVTSSANTAVVKFQARKQGEIEWGDLPGNVTRNGNVWKLTTSAIPTGNIVFRAVASAPNFASSSIEGPAIFVAANSKLPKIPAGKSLTVMPQSPGFPWTFTYTQPAKTPGLTVRLQGSVDGETWVDLPEGVMTRASGSAKIWTLTTADVPTNLRYFRAVSSADGYSDNNSAVFSTVLPAFKALKVATKKPALSAQKWLLTVGFTSKAPNLAVRFQSTLTPENEASWSDLPVYEPATRKGNKWAQVTYNVPAGLRYFRAVASAPGWADSVSALSKPIQVTPSSGLIQPPIVSFNIHPVGDAARSGEPILFTAVQDTVKGATVRFQTKLSSEGEEKWTDLPAGGAQARVRKSWNLLTPLVPSGMRNFRVVASAPQYLDSVSTVQSLEIKEPRTPQLPATFGDFVFPAENQRVFKTGEVVNTQVSVSDPNGLQRVRIQFATGKQSFQDAGSGEMTSSGDGIYRNHSINFGVPGTYFLRVAATDNASPSETSYSSYITILVGAGGGTTGPSFGQFTTSVKQPTAKAKGFVSVSIPIGDDKQVYQALLVRTDSSGVAQGLVGEMVQATKGNTAVRSLTDANLNDGTYYYRVIASDFDGRITASPVAGPFTLSSPVPAPQQPVTINVAQESRFVNPTFPVNSKGKRVIYNHKDMPLPDHGRVRFSYSGLPSGTKQLVVFKTTAGEANPCYTKTITNTSG
ncbi:MAG: cadherin repeat domain-containing protein, partial [Verrucomicrobiaceae bacterium]